MLQGIRHGRPFQPLVTYNTWFAYGTRVDEDAMVAEIDRAASLGVELFVMDAGWYLGAGETSDFDFDAGLGIVDRRSRPLSVRASPASPTTRTASA